MNNASLPFKRIVTSGGHHIKSYTLEDRGLNPIDAYSIHEHALRRDIGDMVFMEGCTPSGRRNGDLIFILEFAADVYGERLSSASFLAKRLTKLGFGSTVEVLPNNNRFRLISWDQGIERLIKESENSVNIRQSDIFKFIMDVNDQPNSDLTPASIRKQIGDSTGYRSELSL